jgi:predicted 2-oxoglutarate/Fe(II)-dependent dioxygenase YbiX
MIINTIKKDNFEYILIDNFYNKDEFDAIQEEIKFLLEHKVSPEFTATAKDNNVLLKKGKGIWVDAHYKEERKKSAILNFNRKLFNTELCEQAKKINLYFGHLLKCTFDATLLNYYSNNDLYEFHTDDSILTSVTMFKIGDFTGGNFILNDEEIEFKENRMIIFSGCIPHKATPIVCEQNNYRITIAQFLSYNK